MCNDIGFHIGHIAACDLTIKLSKQLFRLINMDIPSCVFCYGLKDHFGILADGTVVPCCLDRDGEIALGNAYEQDVREILSSERAVAIAQGFANRHAVEPLCKKCGYARRFG